MVALPCHRALLVLAIGALGVAARSEAQGPGRTGIGFALGGLPVPFVIGFSGNLTATRAVAPHVNLRFDLQLHEYAGLGITTGCPSPCASDPASDNLQRLRSVVVGAELYELKNRVGFFAVALAGLHQRATEGGRTVGLGAQVGGGVLVPLSYSAVVIESRYIRYGPLSARKSVVSLTFGLRF